MRNPVLLGRSSVVGLICVAALQAAFTADIAQAQDVMYDDFESYANSAAMQVP